MQEELVCLLLLSFLRLAAQARHTTTSMEELAREVGADTNSLATERTCTIFSTKAQGYIEIKGKRVFANERNKTRNAQLKFTSRKFGVVRIQSVTTGRFLCLDRKGKVIARTKFRRRTCEFNETRRNSYDVFMNVRRRRRAGGKTTSSVRYVAFDFHGKPKRTTARMTQQRQRHHASTNHLFVRVCGRAREERQRREDEQMRRIFYHGSSRAAAGSYVNDDPDVATRKRKLQRWGIPDPSSFPPDIKSVIARRVAKRKAKQNKTEKSSVTSSSSSSVTSSSSASARVTVRKIGRGRKKTPRRVP